MILLVEDEPSARRMLGLLLRKHGHSVEEADSVATAVRVMGARPVEVVLTDLRLPDGDGLSVIREARAYCPDAEAILLTAYAGWESAKEAMRLGAFDYLEKGGEPDELLRRVDRALEAHGAHHRRVPLPVKDARSSWVGVEGEQRILTVLFADVRGSTELLTHRDLEEARVILDTVLRRMIDAVHRCGGTVNQVLGDGIMALFGAPRAQPDHALRACAAALGMQEDIARYSDDLWHRQRLRVAIRVGISSGEALLRSVEAGLDRHHTAVGTTTHVAARMEQLARPGTAMATGETLRLTRGAVAARPLGPLHVKGLTECVEAYELLRIAPTRPHSLRLMAERLGDTSPRDAPAAHGPDLSASSHGSIEGGCPCGPAWRGT